MVFFMENISLNANKNRLSCKIPRQLCQQYLGPYGENIFIQILPPRSLSKFNFGSLRPVALIKCMILVLYILSRGGELPIHFSLIFFLINFRRLKKMQPQQPGYNSSRVYLEILADLPWQQASEEVDLDLKAAKERLDSDHYGLTRVKRRIIEYLAVRKVVQ